MSERQRDPRRHYVRHSQLAAGEDRRREYKGHRCLSSEEIPHRLRHSRGAISRNINGFLNTGQGGRIFLGVLDDGTVAGLPLSVAQKDHVSVALEDLMGRYTPPVPSSQYRLTFVPVVSPRREGGGDSEVSLDGSEEERSLVSPPSRRSLRGHLLRTARYCWCDSDARGDMILKGNSLAYYVVEISILPFVHNPTLPPMVLQLHPIYQNEQGRCYFRGTTSLQEYTYQQVAEMTIAEVEEHFSKIKKRLRAEIKMYMTKLTHALANLALRQSGDCHMTRPLPPPTAQLATTKVVSL